MIKPLSILAVVIGVVFLILAVVYCVTPANSLPTHLPGYDPSLAKIHYKHGVGSLMVGVVLLAFGWFSSRKKGTGLSE